LSSESVSHCFLLETHRGVDTRSRQKQNKVA